MIGKSKKLEENSEKMIKNSITTIKDQLSILSTNGKKILIKVLQILTRKNTSIGKTCFYLGLFIYNKT